MRRRQRERDRIRAAELAAGPRLTAAFYTLAYLGFAAPYLFALASGFASYVLLLLVAGALALTTAARVQARVGLVVRRLVRKTVRFLLVLGSNVDTS